MNVDLFIFPTAKDGVHAVEELYCYLINKYRDGEKITEEVLDWMDFANNFLQTSKDIKN